MQEAVTAFGSRLIEQFGSDIEFRRGVVALVGVASATLLVASLGSGTDASAGKCAVTADWIGPAGMSVDVRLDPITGTSEDTAHVVRVELLNDNGRVVASQEEVMWSLDKGRTFLSLDDVDTANFGDRFSCRAEIVD